MVSLRFSIKELSVHALRIKRACSVNIRINAAAQTRPHPPPHTHLHAQEVGRAVRVRGHLDAAHHPGRDRDRVAADRIADDVDVVLEVGEAAKGDGRDARPELVVVDREERDVALGADREDAREELAVVAAPLDLDLLKLVGWRWVG